MDRINFPFVVMIPGTTLDMGHITQGLFSRDEHPARTGLDAMENQKPELSEALLSFSSLPLSSCVGFLHGAGGQAGDSRAARRPASPSCDHRGRPTPAVLGVRFAVLGKDRFFMCGSWRSKPASVAQSQRSVFRGQAVHLNSRNSLGEAKGRGLGQMKEAITPKQLKSLPPHPRPCTGQIKIRVLPPKRTPVGWALITFELEDLKNFLAI